MAVSTPVGSSSGGGKACARAAYSKPGERRHAAPLYCSGHTGAVEPKSPPGHTREAL